MHLNGIMQAYRPVSRSTLQNHFILKRATERVIVVVAECASQLNNDSTHLSCGDVINLAAILRSDMPRVSHLQLWDMVVVGFPILRAELEALLLREIMSENDA